jgi:acetyl/propionyl-CoA carboxylase alpha subunit
MREALRHFVVLGIRTNVPYLLRVLAHPAFVAGNVDTRFLDRETEGIVASLRDAVPPPAAKAALNAAAAAGRVRPSTSPDHSPARCPDPWEYIGRWSPGT